ncbi:MAG TPA: biotin--[acetyl-CoA-carboxylase] ligase [Chitinophagaceae bacterium]|nr:biotin--[acetyl-CoA-carboxylase] ligase [Chitinophagaceae bacterium]
MPQRPTRKSIGIPFVELQSVDSTNNYARRLINEGLAENGMAIFAHEQIAGKGQRDKTWTTEKGTNIILSIIAKPAPLQVSQQFELNACIAVAVHDFFSKYAGDQTKIKWPNDLYWQDRKAGGILIENIITSHSSVAGTWHWAIIGIGININQTSFLPKLKNPVSLKQITGKSFDPVLLAKDLCVSLDKYFQQLSLNGFGKIYSYYLDHIYKRKEKVKMKKGNKIFEAVIKGVSSSGKLIVQHSIDEEFDFGEIEWII